MRLKSYVQLVEAGPSRRFTIFYNFPLTCLALLCNDALMFSKELEAASTTTLVLSSLSGREAYGYALIQRVSKLSGDDVQWSEGMVYPVLHWREKEDLIESESREAESGHRRKYYRLRQKGRKALDTEKGRWMAVPNLLLKLWKTQPHLT